MSPPNILFIPIDDLRPQLGCFGRTMTLSPNIDALAAGGVAFTQAYCQVPVCGATRASLLTGVRPTRERFLDYTACVDEDLPGALTLPQHFRNHGYNTVSVGKVFHHMMDSAERSWIKEPWLPQVNGRWRNYVTPENLAIATDKDHRGPPYECADVTDDAYFDGQIADKAIEELNRLNDADAPFFLAAGFLKPHLPFNAPRKYWELYRHDNVELADNPFAPRGAPDRAVHNWGELRSYFDVPKEGPLPEEMARTLVHGYYAATSYVDAQVGRLLDELERLNLADNTIVVLWGDHGWQLGEHGMWCKHCNFETSLNAPLVIHAPGLTRGESTTSIVEFLDVYPTLCELAGLTIPEHAEGTSLAPLLGDAGREIKEAAYCRYHSGDSVRTGTHLYTEWTDDDGSVAARMLYDHEADPKENDNISEAPENEELAARLSALLREGRSRIAANHFAG